MHILNEASIELKRARRLDPNASADIPDKDGQTIRWTLDSYATQLLYLEASYYVDEAKAHAAHALELRINMQRQEAKWFDRKAKESWKRAVQPILKAYAYQPKNVSVLLLAAEITATGWFNTKARRFIKEALAIDPYDPEVLDAKRKYHDLW